MGRWLVTGAAGGIGAEIARAAARTGHEVVLLDLDGRVEALASVIRGAVAIVASTTDEAAIDAALDRIGPLDVVVNNAGIVRFGPLVDHAIEQWRSVIDVNLTGTFVVARAAARRWIASARDGCIINITSMNGVMPGPNAGAYGASKAAVALLTQQMALEWGPVGIRVNAVAPGLIDAGMSEPIYADLDVRARRGGRVPLGRLGTAADIASVVLFLASDAAAYVTGQNLLADGGVTMSVIAGLPRPAAVDGVGGSDE